MKSGEKLDVDTHYSEQDLSWDTSSETAIDLSNPTATDGVTVEDGTLTITKAGTYKLSGEYQGQIKVETADSDAVRLVLDNANITNSSGAALNVVNADEVILYSASGTTNTISDGADYTATGEDDPDAVVYSKADLTIAGEGALKVNGNHEDGIHTSDGLVIASGTLEVNAANTGIKGKDYVDILGGTINVTAQQDGIKSTNDTDEGKGWTRLSNGTVTVNAGDDGFKASRVVEISGGSLTVEQSDEGIEAQYINVSGGDVNVTSADDGMNASLKTSDSEVRIHPRTPLILPISSRTTSSRAACRVDSKAELQALLSSRTTPRTKAIGTWVSLRQCPAVTPRTARLRTELQVPASRGWTSPRRVVCPVAAEPLRLSMLQST